MKFRFNEPNTNAVVKAIEAAMGTRSLSKMVSFDTSGDDLKVTISKLGKSVLTFSCDSEDDGLTFTLSGEKIAMSHKAFKDDVTKKIIKVIEKAGGVSS